MARYALSDLHGRLDLFLKIKELLQPDDVVYFLGDAGDRGPHGWELIKQIYNDPQFVYLKGNHEDMLVEAMRASVKKYGMWSKEYQLLNRNGGFMTFDDWLKDGAEQEWASRLDALPQHFEFINDKGQLILLSHAGYTPWADVDDPTKTDDLRFFDLLWDRDHLLDDWDEQDCVKNSIVVHGHTTIKSLFRRLCIKADEIPWGVYWYCDNHKACIDNYSAMTGKACLLNLDTLDYILVDVDV